MDSSDPHAARFVFVLSRHVNGCHNGSSSSSSAPYRTTAVVAARPRGATKSSKERAPICQQQKNPGNNTPHALAFGLEWRRGMLGSANQRVGHSDSPPPTTPPPTHTAGTRCRQGTDVAGGKTSQGKTRPTAITGDHS